MMRTQHGYALLSVVVFSATLLVVGVATIQLSRTELRSTAAQVGLEKALYVAEAGIHRGLAQLEQDRSTALAATTYSYSTTESFADGSYTIAVGQDPVHPSDASRKRISSTGTIGSLSSTTVAHVRLNDFSPHVCFSDTGDCRFLTSVAAATQLFNGSVYAGDDVTFNLVAGAAIGAAGNIYARDAIVSSGLGLLSTTAANAFRQGAYQGPLGDTHLLGVRVGVHFANPANGHGLQTTVNARPFPVPDYDRIAHQPNTVVISKDNLLGGSWDSASNTWVYTGTLPAPASATTIYYVDGNADIAAIQLAGGARLRLVTRGWLAFQTLTLLSTSLIPGTDQILELVAQGNLSIGRGVVSRSPLSLESELTALANATNGISLGGPAFATTTRIFAYSETGTAWTKASTLTALSQAKMSVVAKGDATVAFTGSILSTVTDVAS